METFRQRKAQAQMTLPGNSTEHLRKNNTSPTHILLLIQISGPLFNLICVVNKSLITGTDNAGEKENH